MLRTPFALFAASLALASAAIGAGVTMALASPAHNPRRHSMSFVLETKAFPKSGEIPARYTCSGDDVSPALSWSGAPQNTKDRKSTRLNSSHVEISYAVFCLK